MSADRADRAEPTAPHHFDEVIGAFVDESRDLLLSSATTLDILEDAADQPPLLATLYRNIHTLKGSASILGFAAVAAIAHALESAMDQLMDSATRLTPDAMATLREAIATLDDLLLVHGAPDDAQTASLDHLVAAVGAIADRTRPESNASHTRLGDMLVSSGAADRLAVELAAAEQVLGNRRRLGEILVDRGDATAVRVAAALSSQIDSVHRATSIRVETALLDELAGLVGRLRESAVELDRLVRIDAPPGRILAATASIRAIAEKADTLAAQSQCQPMQVLWRRLPRVVAHAAREVDKTVEVTTSGDDIDVETAILQSLIAPITHLVRNAVDHGLEHPQVRVAAGKHPTGHLVLRAESTDASLVVEIADDGAGLDLDAIRAKAIERSLVGPATAARLTPDQIAELIFLPGLSTADALTVISGRGVGLDVVRAEVSGLGGQLLVTTEAGRGTTFTLIVPLRTRAHEQAASVDAPLAPFAQQRLVRAEAATAWLGAFDRA